MDDYSGFYVLTEKIKRGPDRVAVDKMSEDGMSGGWIVQIDRMDAIPVDSDAEPYHFHTAGPDQKKESSHGRGDISDDLPVEWNSFFNFTYPKGRKSTPEQRQAIVQWFSDFEKALYSPGFCHPEHGYRRFIDLPSFVDHSIMVNLTRNFDSLNLSTFLFLPRQDESLHLNPVWDFDRSMGSYEWRDTGTDGMWGRERLWMPRLFCNPEFGQALTDRWQALRKTVLSEANIQQLITSYQEKITEPVAAAHFRKLGIESSDSDNNSESIQGSQWNSEVKKLRHWIEGRLQWLDQQHVALPIIEHAQAGEHMPLSMKAQADAHIYFTLDGSDPRAPGNVKGDPIVLVPRERESKSDTGSESLGDKWTLPDFDDSAWTVRKRGHSLSGQGTAPLTRFTFELSSDQLALASLILFMRYSDGFVAYLNGKEVAMSNVPPDRPWPLTATKNRFIAYSRQPEPFDISHHRGLLLEGKNVLAIHMAGQRITLDPELVGFRGTAPSPSSAASKYVEPISVTAKNAIVRARVLKDGRWSGIAVFTNKQSSDSSETNLQK